MLTQRLRVTQTLSLTVQQGLLIHQVMLQRRHDLMEEIWGERFEPKATCPDCAHRLMTAEILRGFLPDPHDVTTKCPECGRRFRPKMIQSSQYSRAEVFFLCPDQTLEEIRDKHHLNPEQLRLNNHTAYYSALYHFGTLSNAFSRLGQDYPHQLPQEGRWQDKVQPFLGLLPDTEIATCAGVSRQQVGRLRRKFGVDAFGKRAVMDCHAYRILE